MDNRTYLGTTAWMVRRDGSIFPVVQHIHGNPEDVEETLFAAEWQKPGAVMGLGLLVSVR